MELQASREEIVERFRLCGEMTCTLFELFDDEDDYANGAIAWYDICDTLDIDGDMEIEVPGEDKPCLFDGVSMDDEKLYVDYVGGDGYHCSAVYTYFSSKYLKLINEIVTRYAYELKRMED